MKFKATPSAEAAPLARRAGVPPAHDVLRHRAVISPATLATTPHAPFTRHSQRSNPLCGPRERAGRPRSTSTSAFTLAEVLAALVFMAIVIPVAVQGLRIASLAGQVGERKTAAARLATRVINEILVTGQWKESGSGGTLLDGPHEYRWHATSETWTENALRLISVQVQFDIQGQPYDVTLSTLADTSQP